MNRTQTAHDIEWVASDYSFFWNATLLTSITNVAVCSQSPRHFSSVAGIEEGGGDAQIDMQMARRMKTDSQPARQTEEIISQF